MKRISIKDYVRMWRAKGICLPIQYFFQNHLFDIIRGTDTHFRLEKEDYKEHPKGFESGVLYMSSVTREVKNSLSKIERALGNRFYDFQYFDLGCGKGKTVIIYSELYGSKGRHKAIGIDYYRPLIDIANNNFRITGVSEISLAVYGDARHFKKHATSRNLILHLYNPFGENILRDVLESCRENEVYLIYSDPAHQRLVKDMGFSLLYSKKGHYPNTTISIFLRRADG